MSKERQKVHHQEELLMVMLFVMHCFLLLLLLVQTLDLHWVVTIPGLGQLMINAIRQKDTPIVMGAVMTTAIFASLINLLVDIVYTYIDPRLASRLTSVKKGGKKV